MRNAVFFLLALLVLLAFKPEDPLTPAKRGGFVLPKGISESDYLPNTIILKLKKTGSTQVKELSATSKKELSLSGVSIIAFEQVFAPVQNPVGIQSVAPDGQPDLSQIYRVKYDGKQSITDVINTLLKDSQVAYAEPSYIYKLSYVPNDPFYAIQTHFTRLQATKAWDVQRDAASVIIGIVDSGSDLQHEDLAGNIYLNTADPINGVDDDHDGYTDNYYGWDFVGRSAATMIPDNDPDVTSDTTAHGVHVSGIASAVSDNGKGVSSLAFNAKLMIIKTGADDNGRYIYKGYEGIKYAVDHGAKIINCSWGGTGGGQFGQDVIDYAVAKGCLVIAAAGNESTEEPGYPAAYKGVLSVASVTNNDVKSGFSNYGYTVDICAPGSSIYSTINQNYYGNLSGTSMATPMVASAAALVKAKYPAYNGLQIGEVLRTTADPIDALNAAYAGKLGKGRLNVYRALTETTSSVRYQQVTINDPGNGSYAPGTELSLTIDLKSFLAPVNALSITVSSSSPYIQVIDPVLSAGHMGTLEEKTNLGPVRIKVLANTPQNQEVVLKFSYSGNAGTYTDAEYYRFIVALDYLNVTVNKIGTTFSSNGRVGFSKADAAGGLGFIYRDEPLLYEAALMVAKSSTQVSNNARSEGNYSEDFAKLVSAARLNGANADFEGVSTFTDEKASSPVGVKVKSKMWAYATAPDDKYVIVEYEITNTTTTDLQGIYTGMFTDWDLDESSANATRFDATAKTAYVYARKNSDYPYAGVRLLTEGASPSYYPMSYQVAGDPLADNKFTTAEKYTVLSSGIKASGLGTDNNGYDVMFALGSGPYTLPRNASVTVAYAFIAGDNLSDLLNSGNAAYTKYTTVIKKTDEPKPEERNRFSLKQNYPNPASGLTYIPFYLPEKAAVHLALANATGKVVATLIDGTLDAGTYHIPYSTEKLSTGLYFYELRAGSYRKALKMIVIK